MGVTYANFDLVCRFLSSLADKSAMFLTEQKQNMGRIKESENVCSQGVNLWVTFNARSSKLICRQGCENILHQEEEEQKIRPYLHEHASPARLWSGETKKIVDGEEKQSWNKPAGLQPILI